MMEPGKEALSQVSFSVLPVPYTGRVQHRASLQKKWSWGVLPSLQSRAKQGKFGPRGNKGLTGNKGINDVKH